MECRTYTDSLTALMDGELPTEEADSVRRHLDDCRTCDAEYQSLLYSYKLVSAATQLDSSAGCWKAIEERIQAPATKRSWWPGLFPSIWIPVGSLGALVLALGSVFWLFPRQDHSEEMRQVLQNYMQQREHDLAVKSVVVQDGTGTRTRFIQYNPFRDPDRRRGENPFKVE